MTRRITRVKAGITMNRITRIEGTNHDGSHWSISTGDRVTCEPDDSDDDSGDAGRVSGFSDASTAIVFWDSGVETPIDVDRLVHE